VIAEIPTKSNTCNGRRMVNGLHKGANSKDANLLYHMTEGFFVFLDVRIDDLTDDAGRELRAVCIRDVAEDDRLSAPANSPFTIPG
jgi:hypothetical protein